ncbi:MAG: hypothetical protein QM205_05015 [Bacillota bacterium]|jgi:hypothetical protein|nr:hypothetical protein [Bacillota bacterium]
MNEKLEQFIQEYREVKNNSSNFAPFMVLFIALISLVALFLNYFAPLVFIIAVFFIILPFYAIFLLLKADISKKSLFQKQKEFFNIYKNSALKFIWRPLFPPRLFLFALLASVGVTSIAYIVFSITIPLFDSEALSAIMEISEQMLATSTNTTQIVQLISEKEAVLAPYIITSAALSSGAFLLCSLFGIVRYSFNFYYKSTFNFESRYIVDRGGRYFKGEFAKKYFWPLFIRTTIVPLILTIFAFVGGIILGYFLNFNLSLILILAEGFALVIYFIFLPHLSTVMQTLYNTYMNLYGEQTIDEVINEIKVNIEKNGDRKIMGYPHRIDVYLKFLESLKLTIKQKNTKEFNEEEKHKSEQELEKIVVELEEELNINEDEIEKIFDDSDNENDENE